MGSGICKRVKAQAFETPGCKGWTQGFGSGGSNDEELTLGPGWKGLRETRAPEKSSSRRSLEKRNFATHAWGFRVWGLPLRLVTGVLHVLHVLHERAPHASSLSRLT